MPLDFESIIGNISKNSNIERGDAIEWLRQANNRGDKDLRAVASKEEVQEYLDAESGFTGSVFPQFVLGTADPAARYLAGAAETLVEPFSPSIADKLREPSRFLEYLHQQYPEAPISRAVGDVLGFDLPAAIGLKLMRPVASRVAEAAVGARRFGTAVRGGERIGGGALDQYLPRVNVAETITDPLAGAMTGGLLEMTQPQGDPMAGAVIMGAFGTLHGLARSARNRPLGELVGRPSIGNGLAYLARMQHRTVDEMRQGLATFGALDDALKSAGPSAPKVDITDAMSEQDAAMMKDATSTRNYQQQPSEEQMATAEALRKAHADLQGNVITESAAEALEPKARRRRGPWIKTDADEIQQLNREYKRASKAGNSHLMRQIEKRLKKLQRKYQEANPVIMDDVAAQAANFESPRAEALTVPGKPEEVNIDQVLSQLANAEIVAPTGRDVSPENAARIADWNRKKVFHLLYDPKTKTGTRIPPDQVATTVPPTGSVVIESQNDGNTFSLYSGGENIITMADLPAPEVFKEIDRLKAEQEAIPPGFVGFPTEHPARARTEYTVIDVADTEKSPLLKDSEHAGPFYPVREADATDVNGEDFVEYYNDADEVIGTIRTNERGNYEVEVLSTYSVDFPGYSNLGIYKDLHNAQSEIEKTLKNYNKIAPDDEVAAYMENKLGTAFDPTTGLAKGVSESPKVIAKDEERPKPLHGTNLNGPYYPSERVETPGIYGRTEIIFRNDANEAVGIVTPRDDGTFDVELQNTYATISPNRKMVFTSQSFAEDMAKTELIKKNTIATSADVDAYLDRMSTIMGVSPQVVKKAPKRAGERGAEPEVGAPSTMGKKPLEMSEFQRKTVQGQRIPVVYNATKKKMMPVSQEYMDAVPVRENEIYGAIHAGRFELTQRGTAITDDDVAKASSFVPSMEKIMVRYNPDRYPTDPIDEAIASQERIATMEKISGTAAATKVEDVPDELLRPIREIRRLYPEFLSFPEADKPYNKLRDLRFSVKQTLRAYTEEFSRAVADGDLPAARRITDEYVKLKDELDVVENALGFTKFDNMVTGQRVVRDGERYDSGGPGVFFAESASPAFGNKLQRRLLEFANPYVARRIDVMDPRFNGLLPTEVMREFQQRIADIMRRDNATTLSKMTANADIVETFHELDQIVIREAMARGHDGVVDIDMVDGSIQYLDLRGLNDTEIFVPPVREEAGIRTAMALYKSTMTDLVLEFDRIRQTSAVSYRKYLDDLKKNC